MRSFPEAKDFSNPPRKSTIKAVLMGFDKSYPLTHASVLHGFIWLNGSSVIWHDSPLWIRSNSGPVRLRPQPIIELKLQCPFSLCTHWVPPARPLAAKLNIGAFKAILP